MLVSDTHRSKKNNFSHEYIPNQANWYLLPMQDIIGGRRHLFHVRRVPEPRVKEFPIEDHYLVLAGLFLSDGTMGFRGNGKVKCMRLTQTKKGKQEFFDSVDKLYSFYQFRRYNYEKETIWDLYGDIARQIMDDFGHAKEKHLPDWCFQLSARQAGILWRGLMLGDGTYKDVNETFYNTNKTLVDGVHAMLVSAGIMAVLYGPYDTESNYGRMIMYHVVCPKTGSIHALKRKILTHGELPQEKKGCPIKEIEVIDRRVVCFEVPNGLLVTRNKGKPAVHGNCKNGAHLIRLLRMGIEFLTEGRLYVKRHDAPQLLQIKRGEWPLEKVQAEAERLFASAEQAYINSKLPDRPDSDAVNKLCVEVVRTHLGL
jgi:hypothetical protein